MPNASSDPGVERIVNTLRACSTESTSFNWSSYSRAVENRLRQGISGYSYHPHYMYLSSATFLSAMDFLYIVQKFPEERKVTVDAEVVCIPLIIWAHHILGLTVAIKPQTSDPFVFGTENMPHLLIQWRAEYKNKFPARSKPHLLMPQYGFMDMAVVLSVKADGNGRMAIKAEERHPLLGYATFYLVGFQ